MTELSQNHHSKFFSIIEIWPNLDIAMAKNPDSTVYVEIHNHATNRKRVIFKSISPNKMVDILQGLWHKKQKFLKQNQK